MLKNTNYKITVIAYSSVPWLLAQLLSHHPVLSFLIAYIGSYYIFYLTIFSPLKAVESTQEVMKPLILIQLIFAGFMCCTSIFYFADHLGYTYFKLQQYHNFNVNEQTYLLAKCQRLALLGHMGLVSGMILKLKPPAGATYQLQVPLDRFLIQWSLLVTALAYSCQFFPSLLQFKYYLVPMATTAQALLLVRGLAYRKALVALFGGLLFVLQILNATLTGYKELIILQFIMISFMAYPYFRRTVICLFFPVLYFLLYALPTLTTLIRAESWTGTTTKENARMEAYDMLLDGRHEETIRQTNWAFLTGRLSEIGMFCSYVKYTPLQKPYYGLGILNNAFLAVIPRALWNQKPNTEKMSMERVYESRVVNRLSTVSAKTRPVVDGYLSAGSTGVALSMLVYGMLTQWLCNKSEALFGGYELGCIVMFNSLFQQLWRGNNWEFLINNLVYGFIFMLMIYYALTFTQYLKIERS
jgi:hypothetical protein